MYMRACLWDNGLVGQKEGRMKPIEATEQGVPGCGHTFAVRHGTPTGYADSVKSTPTAPPGKSMVPAL